LSVFSFGKMKKGEKRRKGKRTDDAPTGSPRCSGRSGVNACAEDAETRREKKTRGKKRRGRR